MSHVEHKIHGKGLAGVAGFIKTIKGAVAVGFIKGTSRPEKKDGEGAPPIAQVAAWNVFGVRSEDGRQIIPERNFFRHAMENGRSDLLRLNRINLVRILRGDMTSDKALEQLGAMHAGHLKKAIDSSKAWAEPNADRTIEAKGSDQPLKDTGNMEQGITWQVKQ